VSDGSRESSGRPEGPDSAEVEELLDELEDLEGQTGSARERRALQRTIDLLDRLPGGRMFGLDDLAQQVVGGFILSAPFVVTEEVWSLAAGMEWWRGAVTALMVVLIGYGTLYGADDERDPDREQAIAGVPLRFVSLVFISYLSVAILAAVFNAPATFDVSAATTAKAVSIGAIFSVVGAATADSVFG
jgi:uncharacterized membrane protein